MSSVHKQSRDVMMGGGRGGRRISRHPVRTKDIMHYVPRHSFLRTILFSMAQTNPQDHERLDINDLSAAIREEEPVYGDSSGPLFAIYTTSAEKRDNRVFARWQKDADGIIIFVCRKSRLLHCCIRIREPNRTVYSPPSSQGLSSYQSKTSGLIHRRRLPSISRRCISFKPIHPSHPPWPTLHHSLPRLMLSG